MHMHFSQQLIGLHWDLELCINVGGAWHELHLPLVLAWLLLFSFYSIVGMCVSRMTAWLGLCVHIFATHPCNLFVGFATAALSTPAALHCILYYTIVISILFPCVRGWGCVHGQGHAFAYAPAALCLFTCFFHSIQGICHQQQTGWMQPNPWMRISQQQCLNQPQQHLRYLSQGARWLLLLDMLYLTAIYVHQDILSACNHAAYYTQVYDADVNAAATALDALAGLAADQARYASIVHDCSVPILCLQ